MARTKVWLWWPQVCGVYLWCCGGCAPSKGCRHHPAISNARKLSIIDGCRGLQGSQQVEAQDTICGQLLTSFTEP